MPVTEEEAAESEESGEPEEPGEPEDAAPEDEAVDEAPDAVDGGPGESGTRAADLDGSAPGLTPVAEEGARTADAQKGENPEAAVKADAKPDARVGGKPDAKPDATARTKAGAEAGAKPGAKPGAAADATINIKAGRAAKTPAVGAGTPAGGDAGAGDAKAKSPSSVEDARPKDAPPARVTPPVPAAPAKPVVKPLVSDLPEERPGGAQDGQNGRLTAFRGPAGSGASGAPAQAGTGPQMPAPAARTAVPKPSAGASAPLPPAAKPDAKPGAKPGTEPGTGPVGRPGTTGRSAAGAPGSVRDGEGETEGDVVGPEGTRRMAVPAPPAQPLKLLAELTNTPPPPQTALRSVVRRFKIWTPLVVLLAVVFVVAQALRPLPSSALDLTSAASYTFNGTPLPQSMPWPSEGQAVAEVEGLGSLGVHGAQTPVPIASVTKVMTAYVILHDHPLSGKADGPLITVDAQAAQEAGSDDQSTAPVRKGQQFTERQMLQLLLIPSGNNIARLLARWDSGTQDAFVAKMTRTAASLGMTHTRYTGASGFEETTVSTAVDQLKLARQVMKNEVFRSVVALPNVDIPGVGRIFNNNNDLVKLGVVGIKTGSSTPAGGALMWAAHRTVDGKQQLILGVVLQQHGGTTVADSLQTALDRSQALIDSVQGGLTSATIVKKGEVVGKVDDGLGGSTPVVAGKDLTAIGWPGLRSSLVLTPVGAGLPHSAKAGTQVGTLSFGAGSARTTVPVVLQSDLSAPSLGAKLTRVS